MDTATNSLLVKDVTEALKVLLTPALGTPLYEKNVFLSFLRQNLQTYGEHLGSLTALSLALEQQRMQPACDESEAFEDWPWKFTTTIMELLHLLCTSLGNTIPETENAAGRPGCTDTLIGSQDFRADDICKSDKQSVYPERKLSASQDTERSRTRQPENVHPPSEVALSLSQLSTVKSAVQFIVCLGLCPNLAPGVGIPLQHRSKLLTQAPVDAGTLAEISKWSEDKQARLTACVSVFADLLKVPEFQQFLIEAHVNDILAAALQLAFCTKEVTEASTSTKPLQRKQAVFVESSEDNVKVSSSPRGVGDQNVIEDHVQLGRQTLEMLLTLVRHDRLIRELLVLTSGVPGRVQGAVPVWLKRACNRVLLRLVKGPKGILNLYSAMNNETEGSHSLDWKQCSTVGRIMSTVPVPLKQADQFAACVSQQLTDLLHLPGKDGMHFCRLVGGVANEMTSMYPDLFRKHFHRPLQAHLLRCLVTGQEGKEALSESELTCCLQDVHKVYIQGQQPQAAVLKELFPVVGVLWSLFCVTRSSVYNTKRPVRELVLIYLKCLSAEQAALCLRHLCVSQVADGTAASNTSTSMAVDFEADSCGGLRAVYAEEDKVVKVGKVDQVDAVLDILKDLNKDGVAGHLLVSLLKELTEMINKESEQADVILPMTLQNSNFTGENKAELTRRVTLLHLMAAICETFGAECLSDNTQILLFVKVSLEKGVAVCRGTSDEVMTMFETEMMSMAMGLLTAVMAGGVKMEEKHRHQLDEMLPLLEVIGDGHPDEFIQEMASDIRIAIATRGAVWSSLQANKKKGKKHNTSKPEEVKLQNASSTGTRPASKPLIEVLPDTQSQLAPPSTSIRNLPPNRTSQPSSCDCDINASSGQENSSSELAQSIKTDRNSQQDLRVKGKGLAGIDDGSVESVCKENEESKDNEKLKNETAAGVEEAVCKDDEELKDKTAAEEGEDEDCSSKSPLQRTLEELCDPLLPVRGHALVALSKLVEKRDSETLSHKAMVQKVFEENLGHGDSYLYLASINGLGALANCFPESVVPSLTAEFADFSRTGSRLTSEHRMKVGEALMKATRNLGEVIPKYRDVLLAAILSGARDSDPFVRASSLSNLGEVCALLKFSLGAVIHEVMECCSSLIRTDEMVVRQAAALTLAKILEGLDKDSYVVLDTALTRLYRLLKTVHETDPDASVRLYANMALSALDSTAREFLFPAQKLEKRIQVLPDADTLRW